MVAFHKPNVILPWRSFTLKELSEGVNPNTCVEMGFNSEELARQYADTVTRPEWEKIILSEFFVMFD
jgi:hypothetical protein